VLRRGGWDLKPTRVVRLLFGRASPSTSNEQSTPAEVTIEARRKAIEHQAYDFVRQATRNPRFENESLPRWNAPVCFAVAGLPTEQGLFALGRLSEIARAAGVRVARPGCKYNFYVVFAPQPDNLLKKAFRGTSKGLDRCEGLPAIREFLSPTKPLAVRVWHNVRPFTRDGLPIDVTGRCMGALADHKEFPVSLQYLPSRLEHYDVMAFSLALVIVDTAYPKPVKLGQLVDFAALVGLADISVDANLGDTPSILRIFDQTTDEQAPALTQWDSAFLNSLYQSDQAAVVQRSQMALKISHDIAISNSHEEVNGGALNQNRDELK
jgi:hypothetical protein